MREVFWQTIAAYNSSTWVIQILLFAVALLIPALLLVRPSRLVFRFAKTYMAVLSLWIAIVYYLVFGASREHHWVLAIFWFMMAVAWIYDLIAGYSTLKVARRPHVVMGFVMMALPLLYPVISLLRGLSFPAVTTPLIPSAVGLYMLGIVVAFREKHNLLVFLLLLHWAIVDISKIVFYDIPEDFVFEIACLVAVSNIFIVPLVRSKEPEGQAKRPSDRFTGWLIAFVAFAAASAMLAGNILKI